MSQDRIARRPGVHPPSSSVTARAHTRFAVAFCVCVTIALLFLISGREFLHWFVIPVVVCGILVVSDVVDWIRGRLDVFDPIGVVGIIGALHFFLAPLLHVLWDRWLEYVDQPPDWRDWIGRMALLNVLGLLLYRGARHLAFRPRRTSRLSRWQVDRMRFAVVLVVLLPLTLAIQWWVYRTHGGITGYVDSYLRDYGYSFEGMGWIFSISESFPILAMFGFVTLTRKPQRRQVGLLRILSVLLVFFGLTLLFGGLRGSRAHVLFALVWGIGLIHFWVRPISRRLVYGGIAFLVAFLYLYGFYKTVGADALAAVRDERVRTVLEDESHRDLQTALLADLSRSDIQAYLLYRLSGDESDFQYARGRTYLGAAALLVPRAIWPDRPPTKVQEGTNALYGEGSYFPRRVEAANVYGFAGEAMLNFGPAGAVVAFAVWGLIIGRTRRFLFRVEPGDSRLLLYPLLLSFCLWYLIADSDNQLSFLVRNGLVPVLVVLLSSTFIRRNRAGNTQ